VDKQVRNSKFRK